MLIKNEKTGYIRHRRLRGVEQNSSQGAYPNLTVFTRQCDVLCFIGIMYTVLFTMFTW